MTKWKSIAVSALLLLGFARAAPAELSIQLGAEYFRWEEFNGGGSRLLEESGPRIRVGADWRIPFGAEHQYLLQAQGSVYGGRVEYDGQACTVSTPSVCNPFMSDTDYLGATAEATVARRFGADPGLEVFAGGGVDSWRRKIQGDGSVQGAIEDWATIYLVAGGGAYWTNSSSRLHARAGVKYPAYTEELPDLYDVTLNPKGRASFFARFSTDFLSGGQPYWGFGVYYDSYRWDESDRERTGSVLVWQPESRQDLIGLYGTYYFR